MNKLISIAAQSALLAALTVAVSVPALAQTTAGATCSAANADAAFVGPADFDLPAIAQVAPMSGEAVIDVTLDANGKPQTAQVVKSAGFALLDQAAQHAVLTGTYRPEVRNCVGVPSSYRMIVDF